MSILVELRNAIADAFHKARPITGQLGRWVLWLDPDREWERLLDRIGGDWELVRYLGSQLEIRAGLEREKVERPRLFYVPLRRDELTVLKEYEFLGPVLERPILKALRDWGVEIDVQQEKTIKPILPILADRWADRPLSAWRELSKNRVLEKLFDEEQVREFLLDPVSTVNELKKDGLLQIFEDFLRERFGIAISLAVDAEDASRRFAEFLLVAEARAAAPVEEGFPYPDRLPLEHGRETCVKFLHSWLRERQYTDLTVQRLLKAEERVHLGPWAATLQGYLVTQGSLSIEEALIERAIAHLKEMGEQEKREGYLQNHLETFTRRALHFWSWAGGPDETAGRVPEWKALALAAKVVETARTTMVSLAESQDLGAITERYIAEGYKVDLLYRRYRAHFDTLPRLEEARTTVRILHRRWQEEINKHFTLLLEAAGGTSAVPLVRQTDFWGDEVQGKKRTALLILDAFRFELGRALQEVIDSWGGPISSEVRPMLASLPSITPIGMAGIVAGKSVDSRVENGEWVVSIPGDSAPVLNLATLEDRRKLIQKYDSAATFLDLRELLELPVSKVPRRKLAVIFSRELDKAGHSGVLSLSPATAEDYVRQAAAALRKLGNAGYEIVHVVTDHGFFLLDEIREDDIIPCQAEGIEFKCHRALIAQNIGTSTLVQFPFGEGGLTLAVPHGVGILQARGPYDFFHGGASLQELIIPHVKVLFPAKLQVVDVRVEMPPSITTRLFDVRLQAVEPTAQRELIGGKLRPRYVELKLFRLLQGEITGEPLATATGSEIFVGEQQREKIVRMRIAETASFTYGDSVRLIAYDADAPGTALHQIDVTLHVEPEP